jgi:hypothetical protein
MEKLTDIAVVRVFAAALATFICVALNRIKLAEKFGQR